jgi:hypothetical protein
MVKSCIDSSSSVKDDLDISPLPDLEELSGEVTGDDPLERLVAAEHAAEELVRLADRLVGRFVDDARATGCSWADIGDLLGISRQAAQQRYTPRWSSLSLSDLAGAGRLTRYTEKARTVLGRAEQLVGERHHDAVRPGHLLLAVLEGDNVAVDALRALGVDRRQLQRSAARSLPRGDDDAPSSIPVSAPARRCLEATLTEAVGLGHNYIGTEHLLLGLLHDDGVASLMPARVTIEATRNAVQARLEELLRHRV